MSSLNKQPHLSRIIDYCIFSQRPLSIFQPDNEQQRVLFLATDTDSLRMNATPLLPQDLGKALGLPVGVPLRVLLHYKGRALSFETVLKVQTVRPADNEPEYSVFIFSLPDSATYINRRPAQRYKLGNQKNRCTVHLTDTNGNALAENTSIDIHDISSAAIGFWCDSSEIAHRFAKVPHACLIISVEGKTLFENSGKCRLVGGTNAAGSRILTAFMIDHFPHTTASIPRASKRIDMKRAALSYVTFIYPFSTDRQIFGHVVDLSETGMKIVISRSELPLPAGLRLDNIEIQMPYCDAFHIDGMVVYTSMSATISGDICSVGVKFKGPAPGLRMQLANTMKLLTEVKPAATDPIHSFMMADSGMKVILRKEPGSTPQVVSAPGPLAFTHDRMLFEIERDRGLLLPGDGIESISIEQNGELVAESAGTVCTADFSSAGWVAHKRYSVEIKPFSARDIKTQSKTKSDRSRNRIVLAQNEELTYIRAAHPLCKTKTLYGHLIDLTLQGLSFYVRDTQTPVFPGMFLRNLTIQFPFQRRITVDCIVSSCLPVPDTKKYQYRIGGQFFRLSPESRNAVALAVQQTLNDHVGEWSEDDFTKLWEFYFESGFIYSKKRRQITAYSKSILETYRKLLKPGNSIFKIFLYRQNDEIKGHLSAVKFFDHGWMVQHLSAEKVAGESAAKAVLDAIHGFFLEISKEQPSEHNYLFFFYREENHFPAIVFGSIRDQINNAAISDSHEVDYCLPGLYNNSPVDSCHEEEWIECREAGSSDLDLLESILLAHSPLPLFRLEGLDRESICRLSVESDYNQMELYRFRRVYVAEDRKSGHRCFAVANFSSPGLNFSELNNSFRVYFSGDQKEVNQRLVDAIALVVLKAYHATSVLKPVMLCAEGQVVPAMFEKKNRYQYFYFDISQLDNFISIAAETTRTMKSHLRNRILKTLAKPS